MKNSFKKVISFLLAMFLFAGIITPVIAADVYTDDGSTKMLLSLSKTEFTTDDLTTAKTVTASLDFETALTFNGTMWTVSLDAAAEAAGITVGNAGWTGSSNKMETWENGKTYAASDKDGDITAANFGVFDINIPANTAEGTYTVSVNTIEIVEADIMADPIVDRYSGQVLTATITVSEPAAAPDNDFEIYYRLDSTEDAEPDNYKDYSDPAADVVASVYLKASSSAILQSFLFKVVNDDGLEIQEFVVNSAVVNGSDAVSTIDGNSILVYLTGVNTERPINHSISADTEVLLGTITYKFKDTTENDDEQDIEITEAQIAIDGTAEHFAPTITATDKGAEIKATYTVTYDDNVSDAEITVPADGEKEHNKVYALDFTVGTREGYTFLGWDRSASATDPEFKSTGTTQLPADLNEDDITLYAIWEVHTHTVTWMSQDGSTELEKDDDVPFGQTLSFDGTIPDKESSDQYSFSFAGWATSANQTSGNPAESYVMGDDDMVLYVAYSETLRQYTVIWQDEDGTELEKDENVNYGATPSYDGAIPTKPADATYTYEFNTWTPDVNVVTGDVTYKATYTATKINYTIKFEGGENPADGVELPDDLTKNNGDTFNLPAAIAAAEGYTFAGWNDGVTTYAAGASYTLNWELENLDKNADTKTVTFTAMFTENTYNVIYNANGGTGTLPDNETDVPYTQNVTIGSGTGLVRNGYTFIGWSTDPTATTAEFTEGNVVNKLSSDGTDVTLYAVWSTAPYRITYDYAGADTPYPEENVTGYDVEDLPITLTDPTKTGYTFAGWTIALETSDDGNLVVSNGNVIDEGTWGNLVVTATWTPAEAPFKVKFFQQNINDDNYTEVTADEITINTGITGQLTSTVFTPADDKYEHFHLSTIEGKNEPVTILADGTQVLNIYYDRDLYTITYAFTGRVPASAVLPTDSTQYKYQATAPIASAPAAVDGYTFEGWDKAGTEFEITADTTITGTWSIKTFTIHFVNDQGDTVEDVDFDAETESITVPAVPAKSENADWYKAGVWGAYDITILEDQTVAPTYAKKTFTITFEDENGDPLPDQGDNTYDIDDPTVVPPEVPEKPGYTGEWPTDMTATPGDKDVQPIYTPIGYKITFETDGGTAIGQMNYTIESTDTLPEATGKTNFRFVKWKVTTADGNWTDGADFNAGTAVTNMYGNVTLTAQWAVNIVYFVESYKYADTGDMLLIVDAADVGEGNVYQYNGATMYYTTEAAYMIAKGDGQTTAVYYTLIASTSTTLTDDQVGNIQAVAGEAATITVGDVNGDGKFTIADANAIYQMLIHYSAGGYYHGQLTTAQRLAADVDTSDAGEDFRGSIKDVEAAIAIILAQIAMREAQDAMFANYVCVETEPLKIRLIEA